MKTFTTAGLAASLVLIAPGAALATSTPETDAGGDTASGPAATETSTVNVLGTGIAMEVELDPDGRLAGVALVEPEVDADVTHRSGHKVRIVLDGDGTSAQI